MVGKISEGLSKFYQQFPRTPAVITAQAKGKRNALAAGRHMLVSTTPPAYGISLAAERFTGDLIADSKEFGVNFMPFGEAELVDAIGSSKGREIDKFEKFDIAVEKPIKTAVPILKAAYAAYECKVIDIRHYGSHRWFVGEIVAMHALKECLALPQETLDLDKVSPLLFLGRGYYLTVTKETIKRVLRDGK